MQKRMPGLDGVRGLAVLAVLAFHVTSELPQSNILHQFFSWGWMGVDLFFALSGFLITGILLDTVGKAGYFRTFYLRRLLRIWPAYLALLAILTLVAIAITWLDPENRNASRFLSAAPWYWLHATNLLTARTPLFSATPLGTGHFWSLAVEEQFYLLWPLVILALGNKPKRVVIAAAIIIGLAPITRLLLLHRGVDTLSLYVLMPTRSDSLAWGALVLGFAVLDRGLIRRAAPILMAVGAIALTVLTIRLGVPHNLSPSFVLAGYSFAGMTSAGIVAYASTGGDSWMNSAALKLAGKYSYAIYLWHVPILYALKHVEGLPLPIVAVATVVLTVAAARLSWAFVERPALSLRDLAAGRQTTAATQG